MEYRDETEEEHRERDARTWDIILVIGLFFKGSRFWIFLLMLLTAAAWITNILGESTRFNNPDIYYSGTDPQTGKVVVTQGCRPEKVLPDGSCDNAITWDTARTAFPHFGPARRIAVPSK
jgi:hypothetical protein